MGKSSINGPFSMAMLNNQRVTEMSGALANGAFVTLVHPKNHWPGWRAAISCTTIGPFVAQLEGQDRDAGVMVTLDLPATQALSQWIGLRENLQETHGFLPSNIGLSCKFSHHPIL